MTALTPVEHIDKYLYFAQLADDFCATRNSPNTEAAYRLDLIGCAHRFGCCAHDDRQRERYHRPLAWLLWCAANDIDPKVAEFDDVSKWRKTLKNDGQAEGTQARRLGALSGFYDWLVLKKAVSENPVIKLRGQGARPKMREAGTAGTALSARQAAALQDAADADGLLSAAIVAVLVGCGPRVSELTEANAKDIRFEEEIRVLKVLGKGDKFRLLPLVEGTWVRVNAYLKARGESVADMLPAIQVTERGSTPLFARVDGQRLTRKEVSRLVARLARAAGIPPITPHDLRRTFATIARKGKVQLDILQQAMGHVDIGTTRGYARHRGKLANHPAVKVARAVARAREDAADDEAEKDDED